MATIVEYLARPRVQKPRYVIDPVAFFLALFGGPILFTLATFWLLFIPVFALGIGGVPYLIIGTPVLLFYLSRHPVSSSDMASLALTVMFCLAGVLFPATIIIGDEETFGGFLFLFLFGIIFAPAWAASFGWVYCKLRRDLYAHPVPV